MTQTYPQPQKPIVHKRSTTPRTVVALLLREMTTTYGRSALGYFWAILEPVAGIALMTFVFSFALRSPAIGTNFPMFFASGMLPFLAYSDCGAKVSQSLQFSRALLHYPGVTFVDALIGRFLMSFMTNVMVALLMFTGLIVVFELRLILDIPKIVLGFTMAFALGLGIGTLNCFLLVASPGWARVWAVLNRPLFIISCIFFVFDTIPMPYRDWLWWNPLVHIVGATRAGIYATYDAPYVSPIYVFSISLICGAVGLLLLRQYHKDLLNM